jgi:hypothetical protein
MQEVERGIRDPESGSGAHVEVPEVRRINEEVDRGIIDWESGSGAHVEVSAVRQNNQEVDQGISGRESTSGAHVEVSANRRFNEQESDTGNRIQVSHDVIPVSTYFHIMVLCKRT